MKTFLFSIFLTLLVTTIVRADEAPKPAESHDAPHVPEIRVVPENSLLQSDRDLIQRAVRMLPATPIVPPKKKRNLLVFDLNVDYDGHRSVVCGNFAFQQLAIRTKAFHVFVSHDPTVFQAESLADFDAVVFNNTVGNVFQNRQYRRNLEQFVRRGGGLLALHGASEAFVSYGGADAGTDTWPLFGEMIGARGMNHRETDEKVFIKIDDPEHPLVQFFPKEGFGYREEILRFTEPYSRSKQRVLLSLDDERSNQGRENEKERPDGDYALAWVKMHEKGRCCYIAFGHNARIYWDPTMLRFHLAAAQFVLGDLDAPVDPVTR